LTIQSGETAMEQLPADQPDLDWVFAANDLMASGALRVRRAAQADQRCAARRGDGSRASRRS
jgi:ABC-type sugar transport system substrate-binding protein